MLNFVKEFDMYSEKNICNCADCPENKAMNCHYTNGNYPCGQQHCWVAVNRGEHICECDMCAVMGIK